MLKKSISSRYNLFACTCFILLSELIGQPTFSQNCCLKIHFGESTLNTFIKEKARATAEPNLFQIQEVTLELIENEISQLHRQFVDGVHALTGQSIVPKTQTTVLLDKKTDFTVGFLTDIVIGSYLSIPQSFDDNEEFKETKEEFKPVLDGCIGIQGLICTPLYIGAKYICNCMDDRPKPLRRFEQHEVKAYLIPHEKNSRKSLRIGLRQGVERAIVRYRVNSASNTVLYNPKYKSRSDKVLAQSMGALNWSIIDLDVETEELDRPFAEFIPPKLR